MFSSLKNLLIEMGLLTGPYLISQGNIWSRKAIFDLARPYLISQGQIWSRKTKFDLARPYLISQGHIKSWKAIFDLARPNLILQGQIRSRKAIFNLARPYSISQGYIRSRNAIADLSTFNVIRFRKSFGLVHTNVSIWIRNLLRHSGTLAFESTCLFAILISSYAGL